MKESEARRDQARLITMLVILVAVVTALTIFIIAGSPEAVAPTLIIAGMLIMFAIFYIFHMWKAIRKGLPTRDERDLLLSHRAQSYAFIGSIYWVLALLLYHGSLAPKLFLPTFPDAESALGLAIFGMAAIFALTHLGVRLYERWT